jgi:glycosyltransferase involved in cell wall biosynthesis
MQASQSNSLIYRVLCYVVRPIRLGKQLRQYPARALRLPQQVRPDLIRSTDAPSISIVTPSYQQGQFLGRTIESVLAQKYPRLEYVIQDGNSTDDTKQVLEQFRARLTRVNSERDDGQADAINRGFRHTSGEIMAWLKSDDILLPGTLAVVGNYFHEHPDVDVVYGHRILIDEHDREIGRWVMPEHDSELLSWADFIPPETLFWRRSIWEKAGGFVDESYRFALDWELLLRLRRAGARFVRIPRFLGAFRVHDEQKTSAQLHSRGSEEMARLRTQVHGRAVTKLEVQLHIFSFLLRAARMERFAV